MSNTLSNLIEETEQLEKQLDALETEIASMEKIPTQNGVDSLSNKLNLLRTLQSPGRTVSASANNIDSTSGNMKKMLQEMLAEHRRIASTVNDLKEDFTEFRKKHDSGREAVTI